MYPHHPIDGRFSELTEAALSLFKEKYRDDIAAKLVEEEEALSEKAARPKGRRSVLSRVAKAKPKEQEEEELEVLQPDFEDFEAEYWQHFEFFKHFFDSAESLSDSLVVLSDISYEKTKKKKKRSRKQAAATRHTSDANSNDHSSTTTSNDNPKNVELITEYFGKFDLFDDPPAKSVPHEDELPEKSSEPQESAEPEAKSEEPVPTTSLVSVEPESEVLLPAADEKKEEVAITQSSEESVAIVEREESVLHKEEPIPQAEVSVPAETVVPEESEKVVATVPSSVSGKKRRKGKNKKKAAAGNRKAVEDYEELKEKTLQLFSTLTGTSVPPPAKKSKKSRRARAHANAAHNDNKTQEILEEGKFVAISGEELFGVNALNAAAGATNTTMECMSSQSATAASHVSTEEPATACPYEDEAPAEVGKFAEDWKEDYDPACEGTWNEAAQEPEATADGEEYAEYDETEAVQDPAATEGPDPNMILSPYMGELLASKLFERLNQEIEDLVAKIAEHNKNLSRVAKEVQETLANMASATFDDPKISTAVYGSAATGLALENSDVDIAICGLKCDKEMLPFHMEALGIALKEKALVTECQVIESATVPVIKTVYQSCEQDRCST